LTEDFRKFIPHIDSYTKYEFKEFLKFEDIVNEVYLTHLTLIKTRLDFSSIKQYLYLVGSTFTLWRLRTPNYMIEFCNKYVYIKMNELARLSLITPIEYKCLDLEEGSELYV